MTPENTDVLIAILGTMATGSGLIAVMSAMYLIGIGETALGIAGFIFGVVTMAGAGFYIPVRYFSQ